MIFQLIHLNVSVGKSCELLYDYSPKFILYIVISSKVRGEIGEKNS